MTSTALATRPEQVRAEVAADPARRKMLQDATAELLTAVEQFIARYVVLPGDAEATALALYVLHTWALDSADATPYMIIASMEKGSGKTRALEVLSMLVCKPWHTASTTEVALFRKISQDHPTLLLDELDTVFRGGVSYEGLRAVLNAGNRRGSTVTRCDGKYSTMEYETFGAKVMAGIDTGFIPETILDRSIVVRMRKRSNEPVQRLRPRVAAAEVAPLAMTLETWALVAGEELARLEPELPESISDRSADAWEPLLAIAEFADGDWPSRAHRAVRALSAPPSLECGEDDVPPVSMLPLMTKALGASIPTESAVAA